MTTRFFQSLWFAFFACGFGFVVVFVEHAFCFSNAKLLGLNQFVMVFVVCGQIGVHVGH